MSTIKSNHSRWLIIAAVAFFFMIIIPAFFGGDQFPLDKRVLLIGILGIAVGLLTALGLAINFVIDRYIRPLKQLAEETNLITAVNPSHRIDIKGVKEVRLLAQVINEKAESFEELQKDVWRKIELATAQSEEEKNILAAIVSELPEGILICNAEGQIILYNKQARRYLEGDEIRTFRAA
ncbi:MAG: hypothetical protein CVU52_08875, partial [Deltaproteobacteria bacterium HGW-Deltaproteobacteria-10]